MRGLLIGWADSVGFGWTWPLDPKTKGCWATLAKSEPLLHGQSCNFSTTLSNMAADGEAYASRSSHGRLNASTAEARGSSSLLTQAEITCCLRQIDLFLAGATCCILSGRPPEGETILFRWSGLDWIACLLLHSAGLECVGLSVTCFLEHQVEILHSGAQSGPDLMPPPLFMYDTTVVLSVATITILSWPRSCNSFNAKKTAFSSK